MSLNNNNQKVAETREQVKQAKKEMKAERESGEKRRRIRIRLIPLWLRLVLIAVSIVLCVILGAMFGYSVMGNGDATDVFDKSTWTHVMDLIKKE